MLWPSWQREGRRGHWLLGEVVHGQGGRGVAQRTRGLRCGRCGNWRRSLLLLYSLAVNSFPTEEMRRVLGEKIGLSEAQVAVSRGD